jgi:hypothetical protein
MLFALITVVSTLALLLGLSLARFNVSSAVERKAPRSSPAPSYPVWFGERAKALLRRETLDDLGRIIEAWLQEHYPGYSKFIFVGLGLSFMGLAASGFFFAVFIWRGMFGLPLFGHMICGAVFSVSLAALLLWRARDYRPGQRRGDVTGLQSVLFWTFAVLGFGLISTALGSMLSIFTFRSQQVLMGIHSYCALGILLTAIVFVDHKFVSKPFE